MEGLLAYTPHSTCLPDDDARSGVSEACPFCATEQWHATYGPRLPWLRECRGCGIQRVFPLPSVDALCQFYGGTYFRAFGDESIAALRRIKRANASLHLRHLKSPTGSTRLLDVGCGTGDHLEAAAQLGWVPCGIDVNLHAKRLADEASACPVEIASFEDYESPPGLFGAIAMCDVFEHLRDPIAALQKANHLLESSGQLLLTIPDRASLFRALVGPGWWHYHEDHLWYFNKSDICRLLNRCGFAVVCCQTCPRRYTLRYVSSVLSTYSRGGLAAVGRVLRATTPAALLDALLPKVYEGILVTAVAQ